MPLPVIVAAGFTDPVWMQEGTSISFVVVIWQAGQEISLTDLWRPHESAFRQEEERKRSGSAWTDDR